LRRLLLACLLLSLPGLGLAAEPVDLGVLAKRGAEHTRARWAPTAEYLTQRIPGQAFRIRPLTFQ